MPGMDPCLGGLFVKQLQGRDRCLWRAASCTALVHPSARPRGTFISLPKEAAQKTFQLELCREIAATIKEKDQTEQVSFRLPRISLLPAL